MLYKIDKSFEKDILETNAITETEEELLKDFISIQDTEKYDFKNLTDNAFELDFQLEDLPEINFEEDLLQNFKEFEDDQ